jgi:nitroreductase
VAVIADPAKSDVWIEDASIAAIIFQLEAEDLGLGSCWIQVRCRTRSDGEDSEAYVRDQLGIPASYRVLCLIAIGVKDEQRSPFDESRLAWEKIHLNRFGQTD